MAQYKGIMSTRVSPFQVRRSQLAHRTRHIEWRSHQCWREHTKNTRTFGKVYAQKQNQSVAERVTGATERIQRGEYREAVSELNEILELSLSRDEARAANYNIACAYSRLKDFKAVQDPLLKAVNNYGLKYNVALEDPDLELFRETAYFDEIQTKLIGGAGSDKQYIKLRSEISSPFRLFRLFLFGGLDAGAGLGLLVILSRLAKAFSGGEGAPDLTETLKNFGINVTAVVLLTYLFVRDLKASKEKEQIVEVEEQVGKLQVQLGEKRIIPISRFRQTYRPVILYGDDDYIKGCLKAIKPYQRALVDVGILVIPVNVEKVNKVMSKAKGFDGSKSDEDSSDNKNEQWIVQPYSLEEWTAWLSKYKESSNLEYTKDIYLQIQLDGAIKQSGSGIPPWKEYTALPKKEDIRSKILG